MTPDTAPEAITRLRDALGDANHHESLSVMVKCADLEAILTSHSAGEGLREASDYEADLSLLETLAANDYATRHFSNQLAGAAKRLRKALSLTPPSDAGSTTLPADVIALVVAGRAALEAETLPDDERKMLDRAVETFASRVCYDDDGGDVPEAHAHPCTCGAGSTTRSGGEGVKEADRALAADMLDEVSSLLDHDGIGLVADLIRAGEYDEHETVEIAARHRLATTPPPDSVTSDYRPDARVIINGEVATRKGDGSWSTTPAQTIDLRGGGGSTAALATTSSPDTSPDSGETDIPDGWKLVPLKATDEMVRAWWLAARPAGCGFPGYAAMLAAAPVPPSPSPAIVQEAGKVERLREVLRPLAVSVLADSDTASGWRVGYDMTFEQQKAAHLAYFGAPTTLAALSASNAAQVSK